MVQIFSFFFFSLNKLVRTNFSRNSFGNLHIQTSSITVAQSGACFEWFNMNHYNFPKETVLFAVYMPRFKQPSSLCPLSLVDPEASFGASPTPMLQNEAIWNIDLLNEGFQTPADVWIHVRLAKVGFLSSFSTIDACAGSSIKEPIRTQQKMVSRTLEQFWHIFSIALKIKLKVLTSQ